MQWNRLAMFLLVALPHLHAAEWHGQVVDAVTSNTLALASVTLDAAPADGTPEFTRTTDLFGFYLITNVAAVAYVATVSRGGYVTSVFTNIVSAVAPTRLVTPLTPHSGGPGHEIWIQVMCVTSAEKLNGVPVAAIRFGSEADPTPSETRTAVTDANGFAQFVGMTTGYYRFEANRAEHGTPRPMWEPFTTSSAPGWPDKTLVNGSRVASFLLKPIPLQALSVRVVGMNPVTQASGPLANIPVELTGHSLHDGTLLVPARHGITGPAGVVTFGLLPAIEWRAKAQRLGFTSPVITRRPVGATGIYAAGPHDIPVTLNATIFEVDVGTPYASPLMVGLPVKLQGLAGTFTEGIARTATTSLIGGRPVATFAGLSPGRYSVSLDATKTSPSFPAFEFDPLPFSVHLRGRGYGEAVDGRTTRMGLPATPVPARVKLRLFVADEAGTVERSLSGSPTARPLYQPASQTGIVFKAAAFTGGLISPMAATATVATGADGELAFAILPGLYGITIPAMTNYWGSEITYWGLGMAEPIKAGWPYGDPWPHPTSDDAHHSGAVPFNSSGEVRLDLYVRKKVLSVKGVVLADPEDPIREQILAQPATADEVTLFHPDFAVGTNTLVTLERDGFPPRTTNLIVNTAASVCEYRFDDVVPGIYEFSVAPHPRHTFSFSALAIGPWAPFPGALPPVPPTDPGNFYPLTVIEGSLTPGHPAGFDPITATAAHGGGVTLDVYTWDPALNGGLGGYVFQFDTTNPQVVRPNTHASTQYFSPVAPLFHVPDGGFDMWTHFGADGWFEKLDAFGGVHDVLIGGPLANVSPANAPDITYTLTIEDRGLDDSTLAIPTAVNTFTGGTVRPHGSNIVDFTGNLIPTSIADSVWAWPLAKPVRVEVLDRDTPHIKVTALLNVGMTITGRVSRTDTLVGVGGANVTVFDHYGDALLRTTSLTNGTFTFTAALPAAQTLFVDVDAAGFKAWRTRFGVTNLLTAGTTLAVLAAVEPLPPPVITDVTFNRRGLFLPGVTKSGDQSAFTGFAATAALTAAWTATVRRAVYEDLRPRFDFPDGTPRPAVTNLISDGIAELMLVDPRSFPMGMYNPPAITNTPPALTNTLAVQLAWLRMAEAGANPNQFVRNAFASTPVDAATSRVASNFLVSDLPAGDFQPVFAAISQRGQIGWLTDYAPPVPADRLQGVVLPRWLATSLDLMSTVAGVQATAAQITEYFPVERFGMLPSFTGAITLTNNFLNYDYGMDVSWSEGMKTPGGGLLSLGPGVLGLTFDGAIRFGVHGEDATSVLQAAAEVETKELTAEDMLPAVAKDSLEEQGFDISLQLRAAGASTRSVHFDPVRAPFEHEVTHSVGGGYVSVITANLTPVLQKIPYIGPFLKAADKAGALTFNGILTGGVGLRTGYSWRTPFPPNLDSGSVTDTTPHVLRRHFLGGEGETAYDLAMCFRFGVGVGAESEWIKSGASLELFLEGTNCVVRGDNNQVDILPAPAVNVGFNTDFDWPLIKRVSGELTAELNAYADLHLKKFEKQYRWELLAFDHQFNTDAVFDLSPLTLVETTSAPAAAAGETFIGSGPQLVSHFYPAGSFASAAGLAVFTDNLPGGGMSLVPALYAGGGLWTAGTPIPTSGGVVDLDLAALPGGGWMLVWSEIALADVGSPFPGSLVRFSSSNPAGTVWSAPATVATLASSVARHVRLTATSGLVSLFALESADGPQSDLASIAGRTWGGVVWSAPVALQARSPIHAFAAAAGGSPARAIAAWRDAAGNVRSLIWNGLPPPPASSLLHTGATGELALSADPAGNFRLAWQENSSGLHLDAYHSGTGWMPLAVAAITNLHPSATAVLASPSAATTVLAWAEGGGASALWWMAVNAAGGTLQAPLALTGNETGRYSDLSLSTDPSGGAFLFARYTNGTNSTLRVFDLDIGAPHADADGDTMPDALELQIVDGDPGDGLNAPADVLPGDDFDGDGHTNLEEIQLGLDPTNPASALRIHEISLATVCCGVDLLVNTLESKAMGIQGATSLNAPAWTTLDTFTGDGFPKYMTVNPTNRTMFMRSSATP